eukprot:scaffold35878_cov33-Attheya_sp.AAC.3
MVVANGRNNKWKGITLLLKPLSSSSLAPPISQQTLNVLPMTNVMRGVQNNNVSVSNDGFGTEQESPRSSQKKATLETVEEIIIDCEGRLPLGDSVNVVASDFVDNEKEVPPTMQAMKLFIEQDKFGPLHWKADSLRLLECSKDIVGCRHCSCFLLDWRKKKHSNEVSVVKVVDHSSVCGNNDASNHKVTNYLFNVLVPVVIPSYTKHRKKGVNMTGSIVRDILSPYLSNSDTISDNTCSKIKLSAEERAFGNIADQGPLLDQIAALCIQKGHSCELYHVTKNEQASILLENRKSEHRAIMKHFNDDDEKGWDFAPRWAQLISPHIRPLYYSDGDGAHMKTVLNGMLFSLWGIDANDQLHNNCGWRKRLRGSFCSTA